MKKSEPTEKISGAEMIIRTLLELNADQAFGYPGGAIMPVYDAFLEHEKEFSHLLMRHEQAAAHAADAFARVSGKPGICFATSGPGATNLVTGIMNAFMDSSPIIAFAGQVAKPLIGNDAFQESDMVGITMPITKYTFQILHASEINSTIKKAFKIATEGRPGPVFIDLPKDIQTEHVSAEAKGELTLNGFSPTLKGNPNQIALAAKKIVEAERPVFLVGGGVMIANASPELFKLAEFVAAPVVTTLMGKSAFPEQHPLCLGMLGMHGRKAANYAVANSDLIVAIGARFSDRITGNAPSFAEGAEIVHIDIDPAEIGKNVRVDVPIVGDAKSVLQDLAVAVAKIGKRHAESAWAKRLKELNIACDAGCPKLDGSEFIHPAEAIKELNRFLKDDDIVVTGVGQHQMFAAHFLKRQRPRTFISSGGAGTMGFGLPAAIGAKVAKPAARVFDWDGDGGFQMVVQELATIAENNIKIVPIIMDNKYLGMVAQWQRHFFGKRYSNVFLGKTPDYCKLAEAYGLRGIVVERLSEFHKALEEASAAKETVIIDLRVQQEADILPMFAPGKTLKDAFGPCIEAGYFEK